MAKNTSSKTTARPTVTIPSDVAEPLREFSQKTGIPIAQIARLGLRDTLSKLLSGRAQIINGTYVETAA